MLTSEPDLFKKLKLTLESLVELTEADWDLLRTIFVPRTVEGKNIIVRQEEVAQEIYFIGSGLARLYYKTANEDQVTAFIFSEGMFAGCLESFIKQEPSTQTFETLETSILLAVNKQDLDYFYKIVPITNVIMRKVMEARFISSQRLLSSYILSSPQERYESFSKDHPNLVQRVPQYILASFLGVTPVSLSRIRKRITKSR